MKAVSTRPYLIRAIYDWATDSSLTPFLLVDARGEDVVVPEQFVEDNSIVLNIAPSAVRDLHIGEEFISFNARFAGKAQELFVPVQNVRAIYAKENGEGLMLPEDSIPKTLTDAAVTDEDTRLPTSEITPKETSPVTSIMKSEQTDGEPDRPSQPSTKNAGGKPTQDGPKKSPPTLTIVE